MCQYKRQGLGYVSTSDVYIYLIELQGLGYGSASVIDKRHGMGYVSTSDV